MLERKLVESVLFDGFDENAYIGSYTMTAVEAQPLRDRVAAIKTELDGLLEEYEKVSGTARAAITRQMTPLREEQARLFEKLQSAAPAPIEEKEFVARYLLDMQAEIDQAKAGLQQFVNEVNAAHEKGHSLAYVIRWRGDEVPRYEERIRVLDLMVGDFDADSALPEIRKRVNRVVARLLEDSLQPYRTQSTSPLTNEMDEQEKYEKRYMLVRSSAVARWHDILNTDTRWGWDAYITWKHLQDAA